MKVHTVCMFCQMANPQGVPDTMWISTEINDTGAYQLRCAQGHDFWLIVQQPRYELLFTIAANALIDGYYREAVLSFAGCLESFYEFFCQVSAFKLGIEAEMFERLWARVMGKRSERQLGAYVIAHLLTLKQPPRMLSQSQEKFRNDVVHSGVIPTKKQAVAYGQEVLETVDESLERLKADAKDALCTAIGEHVKEMNSRVVAGAKSQLMAPGGLSISSTQTARSPGAARPDLATELQYVLHWRKIVGEHIPADFTLKA